MFKFLLATLLVSSPAFASGDVIVSGTAIQGAITIFDNTEAGRLYTMLLDSGAQVDDTGNCKEVRSQTLDCSQTNLTSYTCVIALQNGEVVNSRALLCPQP